MATSRFEERIAVSLGQSSSAGVKFEENQALCGAGVLFMLPALLLQGLLKTKDVYQWSSRSYYQLESVVLTLAIMALSRIKNPEQLKQCKPGEIGRIIGLDRIPQVRCLRDKIKYLSNQKQASILNNRLIDYWYNDRTKEDAEFLYIDGHTRIYFGHQANLPTKYVSRQKLCLSATTEYWVNDAQGMPVMMVLGELTEKLQHAIENQIIPQLQQTCLLSSNSLPPNKPVCTFVFDREAYEPAFFNRLWENHKIAVITYRKNVKDIWLDECFENESVQVLQHTVIMQLSETKTELGGYWFREIRRKSQGGHQTSIITNHPSLEISAIAGRMFSRWSQENYFKYLIQDYDFDKMISFGVESIDDHKEVVNPQYRKLTHQIKKIREKTQRLEAKFYPLVEKVMDEPLDDLPIITEKQIEQKNLIDQHKVQENELVEQRAKLDPKIKLCQMPNDNRYNKLKTESKILMNVIKMICYRAETSVATWVAPFFSKAENEKRMLVKQIIACNADVIPDYQNKTLNVTLHSLSAQRYNIAAYELTKILNETQTIFPGTDLKMFFKISAIPVCSE